MWCWGPDRTTCAHAIWFAFWVWCLPFRLYFNCQSNLCSCTHAICFYRKKGAKTFVNAMNDSKRVCIKLYMLPFNKITSTGCTWPRKEATQFFSPHGASLHFCVLFALTWSTSTTNTIILSIWSTCHLNYDAEQRQLTFSNGLIFSMVFPTLFAWGMCLLLLVKKPENTQDLTSLCFFSLS